MAEADNTLAGLVQMNDQNLADIDVSNLLQNAPLLQVLFAVAASNGTLHKYLRESVASGSEFRDINTGIINAAGQEELVTNTLKYLDGSFFRDVAVADGYTKGRGAYMEKQVIKALKSLFAGLEKQILQSTSADSDGFTGFPSFTTVDSVYDGMVVDAEGAGGESVWLVKSDEDNIAVVAGNDGNVNFDMDLDVLTRIITNTTTGAGYSALLASIASWYGLQSGSIFSLGRIVNLDGTSSHTLTDDMISDAISNFPTDRQPDYIVMSRVKLKELQQSRTATNSTGAPAPFPTESFGVPIVVSDHIATGESQFTTTTTTTTTV